MGTASTSHAHHASEGRLLQLVTALAMTLGRRPVARVVADLAEVGPDDEVVDVGCGPGAAVREAARRGASATGVDPSPTALRLARWFTSRRQGSAPTYVEGKAESLPLPDAGASVVWSLSSVHHWQDRDRGLAQVRRVLSPAGRLVITEGVAGPNGRRAHHSLSEAQVADLAAAVGSAGFVDVASGTRRVGRRSVAIVTARVPAA